MAAEGAFGTPSPREWAVLTIAAVCFAAAVTFVPSIWRAVVDIARMAVCSKLLILWIWIALGVAAVAAVLAAAGLWRLEDLKDTVVFYLFAAVPTVGAATAGDYSPRKGIAAGLSFTAAVGYLVGSYTFSFGAELVLQTALGIVGVLGAVAATDSKHKAVEKLAAGVMTVAGFGFLVLVAVGVWIDPAALGDAWRGLLLPVLLAAGVAPFVYAVVVVSGLERLWINLQFGADRPGEVTRYAKRRSALTFWRRPARLTTFVRSGGGRLRLARTRRDVDEALTEALRA